MENRRSFFKGISTFIGGVIAAKASTYIPKKEEPKEELMVSSGITLNHNGEEYHPLVVKKTSYDGVEYIPTNVSHSFTIQGYEPKIRKAKV